MLIQPPQQHMSLLSLLSAGMLPINTVGLPAAQGATVMGMHGMGVSTPKAAAVADATMGLAMLLQTPNGGMLSIGTWSMMLAAGMLTSTLLTGSTCKVEGAAPKVQLSMALPVTSKGMVKSSLFDKAVQIDFQPLLHRLPLRVFL